VGFFCYVGRQFAVSLLRLFKLITGVAFCEMIRGIYLLSFPIIEHLESCTFEKALSTIQKLLISFIIQDKLTSDSVI